MGAQSSKVKSSTDILNKSMMSVMIKNQTDCAASNNQLQSLNIGNIRSKNCSVTISGISQEVQAESVMQCFAASQSENEMKTDLKNAIVENMQAETSGIAGALVSSSDVDSTVKIANEIATNINITNLLSCVNTQVSEQLMDISNIQVECTDEDRELNINNISQAILAAQISKCTQNNTALNASLTKLDTQIEKQLSAKNLGMGLGGGASVLCSSILICLYCLISMFILFGDE